MESQWVLAVIVVVGSMLLLLRLRLQRGRGKENAKPVEWPSGPSKLPIIGNLHQLYQAGDLMHQTLAKMAQQHGRIMTVWLGSWKPMIVVSDYELAWEVLVTKAPDYAARTLPYMSKFVTADWNTLATSDFGPYWHSLRKGLQGAALNPHNISAQTHLQESEVRAMVDAVGFEASKNKGVVRPVMQFRRVTMRLVARLCFGSDFKNEEFVEGVDSVIEDTIRLTGHARPSDVFTFTRHIPGLSVPFQQFARLQRRIEELIRPLLSLPKPNTYLHFLKSQNLPERVVIFNLFELFLLSVDSTSTSTAWALGFLIRNQETQQKLYDEIKSVTGGGNGRLGVEEVNKMLYIHAVVKEAMRMKPIAPLALPHRAVKDCTLDGTKLAEGTPVMVNLYPVLYDPKVWEEPERFMPERFLTGYGGGDAAARLKAMDRSFLPFGAGRRVCAGMDLAKLHVALVLGNLVSAFEWAGVDGKAPDLTEEFTFVLRMKTPLVAQIQPRDH